MSKPKSALAGLLDDIRSDTTATGNFNDVVVPTTATPSVQEMPPLEIQEVDKAGTIPALVWIKPEECIPWRFADRPENELGDIDALAESLQKKWAARTYSSPGEYAVNPACL